jgi:filamentous hemagglutinin
VGAVLSVIPIVGRVGGGLADIAFGGTESVGFSTAARVAELRSAIPIAQQGRITMAVGLAEDSNGVQQILIGTSEPLGYIRPGLLQPGEIVAGGLGHAEEDIVLFAQQKGWTLLEVGATRPICPFCAWIINVAGATPVGALKPPW